MHLSRMSARLRTLRRMFGVSLSALVVLFATPVEATITTGNMTVPRMMHRASGLPDGRILLTGGYARPGTAPYASAEIYDPITGLFTPTAPMLQARTEHASVTLGDGRVMVLGGSIVTSPSLVGTSSTEIYDPATGQWTAAANMNVARGRAMARLLPDGRVFVMSSDRYSGAFYAEVYDPQADAFTKTGNILVPTGWHGLVVLGDGRVMKVGGYAGDPSGGYSNRAEIWDPATNQWGSTGSMMEARQDIRPVLLPDGEVLVAGGRNVSDLRTTEIYDPATGQFSAGSDMPTYMSISSATTLPSGDIILMGDYSKDLIRYQLTTGQWNRTGPKRTQARETSISLLPGGDLLLAGGAALSDATTYAAVWDHACAAQQISLVGATSQNIDPNGGQASFTVTAAPGCRFEVAGLPAWVSASATGVLSMPDSGSMTIEFSAPANSTGADRTASFTVGNIAATVAQFKQTLCPSAPTPSPTTSNLAANASSGTIQVAAAANCPWTVGSLASWVTVTSATSGTGNGSLSYTVTANTGTARSVAGQLTGPGYASAFVINQAAGPCASWTISPTSANFPANGASGSFSVTAPSTCNWTLSALPSWITITSSSSGSGSASINYSVAANSGAARNAGPVLSGSGPTLSLTLSQAGAAAATCSNPITSGSPIASNLKGTGCPAGARGASYYTDRYTFSSAPGRQVSILLTSSAFDTYLYLRDPSGAVIKSDDDGGGSYNSRIPARSGTFTLPPGSAGTYTIEVTSYGSYKTGAYSLSFTQY